MRWTRWTLIVSLGWLLLSSPAPARAADRVWVGGSGNWMDNFHWDPFGAPVGGDRVFATAADSLHKIITFNDTRQIVPIYNSLLIDESGPGSVFLRQPGGHLFALTMNMGVVGGVSYEVTGGTASFLSASVGTFGSLGVTGGARFDAGTFNVTPPAGQRIAGGVSCATFEFNNAASFGGSLLASQGLNLNVGGAVIAGDLILRGGSFQFPGNRALHVRQDAAQVGGSVAQAGSFSTNGVGQINVIPGTLRLSAGATWTQTGGQNFGGTMIVGAGEGGATYTLNDGTVRYSNGGGLFLGHLSDGTFVQHAGLVDVGGLVVGGAPTANFAAHRGAYVKHGGTLGNGTALFAIYVGRDGSTGGTFTHAGGTTTTRELILNENATNHAVFAMTGGSLSVSGRALSHGTFNQTSGVATFAGNFDGAGTVSVTGDATLLVLRLRQNALHVGGNARVGGAGAYLTPPTHRVQALSFEDGPGGTVRGLWALGESDLIVDYTGASPLNNVKRYLTSGYAGGSWNGTGLQSPGAPARDRALGFAEASDVLGPAGGSFSGVFADATSVLVKYTRYGDANLDGQVNLQDFNRLAASFGQAGRVWSQGDFTYDGVVNLQDFNRLASNFGLSAAGPGVTPDDWAALAAAIPEPALAPIALLGVAASAGLWRRRT